MATKDDYFRVNYRLISAENSIRTVIKILEGDSLPSRKERRSLIEQLQVLNQALEDLKKLWHDDD